MRVLLIDVNCKNSSTGKIVYDLYSSINEAGDEAAICYGRGPLVEEKNISKFSLDWETNIHGLLTRLTGLTGCFSYFSTKRLLTFIERFKPDVVHIHELHAYFVNIAPLVIHIKRMNMPIIWTFHCEFMYTGKCGITYECERYKEGCGHCPQLKAYPKTLFFDFTRYMLRQKQNLLKDYSELVIVTPSKWLAKKVKDTYLTEHEIAVIHNGIDTSIFKPQDSRSEVFREFNIDTEKKVILSVASHIMSDPNKGCKFITEIAAFPQVRNLHFLIIGSDKAAILNYNNITIVPTIRDQRKLAKIYSACDVFLICSKSETFPTTCIEAQCCGLPICGFKSEGTIETCVLGEENFCDYGDVEMLRQIIVAVASNSINTEKGKIAMLAMQKYSKTTMNRTYQKYYSSLLTK